MQLSPYELLLLTQPLHSSEQHIRANLEFSSNFEYMHRWVTQETEASNFSITEWEGASILKYGFCQELVLTKSAF